MPTRASSPRSSHASASASCSSPSFTPVSSWGWSGWGLDSDMAMSRYVTPASNAPPNTGMTKRGSAALSTASHPDASMHARTAPRSLASRATEENRGSPVRSAAARARAGSRSAITTDSNAVRRRAIWAKAEPTPPLPTTRIFIWCSERVSGVGQALRRFPLRVPATMMAMAVSMMIVASTWTCGGQGDAGRVEHPPGERHRRAGHERRDDVVVDRQGQRQQERAEHAGQDRRGT